MAVISDYSTLQTAIGDYLARSDLSGWIPNFIQNCENKLYRELNLRNEETALSVNVSSGVAAVPTDFKALKFAYYNGNTAIPLQWVELDELYRDYPSRSTGATSSPSVISREGSNFVFGPVAADGTAVLKGIYYAKQDPLRTTDPSWYVTNAPELLLYGSLLEAEAFIMNDPRLLTWKEFYTDAIRSLKQEEANSSFPTQALKVRTA